MENQIKHCEHIASEMRKDMVRLADVANDTMHWGGSMSCTEILAVLYGELLNCRDLSLSFQDRDKLLLSKGHAALALYSVMVEIGMITMDDLSTYQKDGSDFSELAAANDRLGIEMCGGSLGNGLSYGVGLALSAQKRNYPYKTVVIVGDGEIDEGSIWEGAMSASQFKLDNLVLIVDANAIQSDGHTKEIMSWENLEERLESFGWEVVSVDGHDCSQLLKAWMQLQNQNGKPKAIVAHTIKGKGISFCEDQYLWHDKVMTKAELEQAKKEVGLV